MDSIQYFKHGQDKIHMIHLSRYVCFVPYPVFYFSSVLAMKLLKYYVIFVYILQGQTGQMEIKRKEKHTTEVTKDQKRSY